VRTRFVTTVLNRVHTTGAYNWSKSLFAVNATGTCCCDPDQSRKRMVSMTFSGRTSAFYLAFAGALAILVAKLGMGLKALIWGVSLTFSASLFEYAES
jgi:hypothetical protein